VSELPVAYWLAPLGAAGGLLFAYLFYRGVLRHDEGEPEMVRVAAAVREGAYAYLSRQRKVIAVVFAGLVAVLIIIGPGLRLQPWQSALGVPVAGFLSGLCGYFGMGMATNASSRTAAAAKRSLDEGLRVAFRAGAVMGLCVTGFALLDVSVWFLILTRVFGCDELVGITSITLSFAMGASLQALFARVGGGIYTKAADVGADLIGKVEAGIPEDDARNPATIADNVGDNVGDVAGMGADLYESYYGSILAAMALAAAAAHRLGLATAEAVALTVVPPALAGLGILASVASIYLVRTREGAAMTQLLRSLRMGVWASSLLIIAGSALLLRLLVVGIAPVSAWGIWTAIVAGLLAGLVIAWGTEVYTSYEHRPTRDIGEQARTGPATLVIAGVAAGMKSTWIPLASVVVAILVAFHAAGGGETFLLGVFGVGLAAVGMLSTLGITLATDAYGPIADNAGGNAEMTHQPRFVRERTDVLDSLGNTTAATGKGFAIGSAALTALALLAAYVITVQGAIGRQIAAAPAPVVPAAGLLVYQGDGRFLVAVPGGPAGAGLLLAPRRRAEILAMLAERRTDLGRHAVFDRASGVFRVNLPRETDVVEFEVVPARDATLPQVLAFFDVTLMNPRVLAGLFGGVMLVFVFCAMTLRAVGRAAHGMMLECRRQFEIMRGAFRAQGMSEEVVADPTRWPFAVEVDGKSYPDYTTCVAMSTAGAQREMIAPSLMAVIAPIAVGLVLGVAGVMGLLAGALVTGFAMAIFMANAGGAWDNAKKFIEAGHHGGKGSSAHKAGVVGDTVGDPFKDTSGPSLNILIKLMSVVSVVFAGPVVEFSPVIARLLHL